MKEKLGLFPNTTSLSLTTCDMRMMHKAVPYRSKLKARVRTKVFFEIVYFKTFSNTHFEQNRTRESTCNRTSKIIEYVNYALEYKNVTHLQTALLCLKREWSRRAENSFRWREA
jgi:hypothetical protein